MIISVFLCGGCFVGEFRCGHAFFSESLVVGVAWMPTIRHPAGPRATSK
jgi:hypothetical protein